MNFHNGGVEVQKGPVHDPDTDPHQVKSRIWIHIREKSDPDLDPMKEHWFVELV